MKKNLVDTRFLALDALRLVLAFWVLYHHLAGISFAFRTSHETGILEWISFVLYKTGNFAPKSILVTDIKSISIPEDSEDNQRISFTIAVLNNSKSNAMTSFCMIFMKDFEATLSKFEIEGLLPPRALGTIERTLEITKDVKLSSNPERWIARCF